MIALSKIAEDLAASKAELLLGGQSLLWVGKDVLSIH